MDGRLGPICCASENACQPCTCLDEDHCGLRMIMIDVRNASAAILARYSAAQVVEVTLRKMRRGGIASPFATAGSLIDLSFVVFPVIACHELIPLMESQRSDQEKATVTLGLKTAI